MDVGRPVSCLENRQLGCLSLFVTHLMRRAMPGTPAIIEGSGEEIHDLNMHMGPSHLCRCFDLLGSAHKDHEAHRHFSVTGCLVKYVWGLYQKTDRWTDMKWLWLVFPAWEPGCGLTEPIDRVRRPEVKNCA